MISFHLDDLKSTSMDSGVPFVTTSLIRLMPPLLASSWDSQELFRSGPPPVQGETNLIINFCLLFSLSTEVLYSIMHTCILFIAMTQVQDQYGLMIFSVVRLIPDLSRVVTEQLVPTAVDTLKT